MVKKIREITGEENYNRCKFIFYNTIKNFKLESLFTKKIFKLKLGYKISFNEKPITFNQKIQFRKMFDKNPLYSTCSDKYRVRDYVKEKIGEEYLIPLYFAGEKFTEIEWEKLPNKFVLKTNQASGTNIIVKNKKSEEKDEIIKKINNFLKIKYGTISLEKYYDEIKPMIIAEELLKGDPEDYKFHCFKQANGEVMLFLQIDYDRHTNHGRQIYDENFNLLELEICYPSLNKKLKKPKNFEKMKELAKSFSSDFEYVRVDLYNLEGKIYFGELTFAHGGGFERFIPQEWDTTFGKFWNQELSEKNQKHNYLNKKISGEYYG